MKQPARNKPKVRRDARVAARTAAHARARYLVFGLLSAAALSVRCMPDIEGLSTEFGAAGVAGRARGGSGGLAGGTGGSANPSGGAGAGGVQAGTHAGGSPDGGMPSSAGAGAGGVPDAGAGGTSAGAAGMAGLGGAGGLGGSGGDAGTAGAGGAGGEPSGSRTCVDGCAVLHVPFTGPNQGQFFTVTVAGDFSDAVVTVKVRATELGGGASIMLYALAEPNYDYWNGTVPVTASSIAAGTTLTMDLTGPTPDWDKTKVVAFGILVFTAASEASYGPVSFEVEEILADGTNFGPWLFDDGTYTGLAVNPFDGTPGSTIEWVGPR